MDIERYLAKKLEDTHLRLVGVVVNAMCCSDTQLRARMILNTAGLIDSILREFVADLQRSLNGVPTNGERK